MRTLQKGIAISLEGRHLVLTRLLVTKIFNLKLCLVGKKKLGEEDFLEFAVELFHNVDTADYFENI